jgi:hypothetical protein
MTRKKLLILVAICAVLITAVSFNFLNVRGKVVYAAQYARYKVLSAFQKPQSVYKNNLKPSDVTHLRCVMPDKSLDDIIAGRNIKDSEGFNIFIDISKRNLCFKYKEEIIKEYTIGAGKKTDEGFKEIEGDKKTPIGEFFICEKTEYYPSKKYIGSRWMMLSYPNNEAADKGRDKSLISQEVFNEIRESISNKKTPPQNTKLGNYIGIHGGARPEYPRDWTAGCIGMYDQDVEEIYEYLKVGSRVVIK